MEGIDAAAIYGSWAARYHGDPGHAPADIDVLVIGRPVEAGVYIACRLAAGELARPVHPTILTPDEWADRRIGFLRGVAGSPLVPVIGKVPGA